VYDFDESDDQKAEPKNLRLRKSEPVSSDLQSAKKASSTTKRVRSSKRDSRSRETPATTKTATRSKNHSTELTKGDKLARMLAIDMLDGGEFLGEKRSRRSAVMSKEEPTRRRSRSELISEVSYGG